MGFVSLVSVSTIYIIYSLEKNHNGCSGQVQIIKINRVCMHLAVKLDHTNNQLLYP